MTGDKEGLFSRLEGDFRGKFAFLRKIRETARANKQRNPSPPRQRDVSYNANFASENSRLRPENATSCSISV